MDKQKSIYSLKLHEMIELTPINKETALQYYSVMRVAGGWIYSVWDCQKDEYVRDVFIPFNSEFKQEGLE